MTHQNLRCILHSLLLLTLLASIAHADGPADNHPDKVRRVPRLGIEPSAEDREKLSQQLSQLGKKIDALRASSNALAHDLLPDVMIYHRAVDVALKHQEFFAPGDIKAAFELLAEGSQRADELANGNAPWTTQTGLVVRGFVSRLDQTVQPYGLVIPDNYDPSRRVRLDVWFHGRGETLSEVKFLQGRRRQVGVFSPANTIVLHPYGRYSNANKFAGEIDVLEGIADVKRRYAIDSNRIAVRGFSMGGASTWQLAVHYPTRWVAANPGAGFSETPEFLRTFQGETLNPTWWERKLWHWYDCDDWAVNLAHCPTVAYSGEIDRQKQAADVMAGALREHGMELTHLIGPKTGHKYHPEIRDIVDHKVSQIAALGRRRLPRTLHFVTYTLRYNQCAWLTVDGLGEHWERGRVDADLSNRGVKLSSRNITEMTLRLPPGAAPFDPTRPVAITIDDQRVVGAPVQSDRSWTTRLFLRDGKWSTTPEAAASKTLRKRHLLQGPIDDAFMDSFLFVAPTGQGGSKVAEEWSRSELDRAITHWRRHFRGEAQVKDDGAITENDIRNNHLVLWGTPQSNALLRKVAGDLPIQWDEQRIVARGKSYDAASHSVIMIFPNPLNPDRYVVLNSSFTFREYAYLNNARQVPMLPDWAIVDLSVPPGTQWPGRIVDAGFFDEHWQVKQEH